MHRRFGSVLLVLVLAAAGGLGYALWRGIPQPAGAQGYICPITGQELPCPRCCPLYTGR
jgi:hypothetical protein